VFDNVGRDLDEEANKRRAATLAILALIGGGTAAFIVAWGAFTVAKKLDPSLLNNDDMVEIVLEDAPIEEDAPPPPPPPPPGPEVDQEVEEDDDEIVAEADEMVDEIKELDEAPDTEIKQSNVKGDPRGVEGGQEGGDADRGVLGSAVIGATVQQSQIKWKVQTQPNYPKAAETMDLGEQRCKVKMYIDEKGVPFKIDFVSCPKVFEEETERALMTWRAYPYKVGSEKTRANFQLTIVYRQR
jgi:outer membrane biosynthesis protein TonB